MGSTTPIDDIVLEAQRIVNRADERRLTLRLFGGMARELHCVGVRRKGLRRNRSPYPVFRVSAYSSDHLPSNAPFLISQPLK
jgi:hypothetical protein